jgi:hypothetical protein
MQQTWLFWIILDNKTTEDVMKIKSLLVMSGVFFSIASCIFMKAEIVSSSFTDSKPPEKIEEIVENQDIIEIDTIAFEAEDFLGIRERLGKEFATYQRFPNPNYKVLSAKLFTPDGKRIYTMVPDVDQFGTHIYIKNNKGKQGKIDINSKPKMLVAGMKLEYTINTDFFQQPYIFHFHSRTEMGFPGDIKTHSQYILYYEEKPVLAYVSTNDMAHPENNNITIVADHDFFLQNKQDLATWCVIFILVQDINNQLASESNYYNVNNSFNNTQNSFPANTPVPIITPPPVTRWNNNGTIDNNNNPFDNF